MSAAVAVVETDAEAAAASVAATEAAAAEVAAEVAEGAEGFRRDLTNELKEAAAADARGNSVMEEEAASVEARLQSQAGPFITSPSMLIVWLHL